MDFQRTVPAVATTNAVIASLLVQEAFRYTTLCCCGKADRQEALENYLTYSGEVGAFFDPLALDRNPVRQSQPLLQSLSNLTSLLGSADAWLFDGEKCKPAPEKNPARCLQNCLVCGSTTLTINACKSWSLAEFVSSLEKSLRFKKPTVRGTEVSLFLQKSMFSSPLPLEISPVKCVCTKLRVLRSSSSFGTRHPSTSSTRGSYKKQCSKCRCLTCPVRVVFAVDRTCSRLVSVSANYFCLAFFLNKSRSSSRTRRFLRQCNSELPFETVRCLRRQRKVQTAEAARVKVRA